METTAITKVHYVADPIVSLVDEDGKKDPQCFSETERKSAEGRRDVLVLTKVNCQRRGRSLSGF